jgi:hypothetical protein
MMMERGSRHIRSTCKGEEGAESGGGKRAGGDTRSDTKSLNSVNMSGNTAKDLDSQCT